MTARQLTVPLLVAALLVPATPLATAADLPDAVTPVTLHHLPTAPGHQHAIAASVLRVFNGTLEVAYEHRLAPRLALVVLAAVGSAHVARTDVSSTLVGAGSQFRWYFIGEFDRGLLLAGDLRYEYRTAAVSAGATALSGTGHGIGIGAWGGGMWTFGNSIFAEAGLGAAWDVSFTQASWTDGSQASTGSAVRWLGVIGLGLGF